MNYIVSAITDIGLKKSTNQDSYGVKLYTTDAGRIAFAVLCDGMGGLSKGELASATVVRAFLQWADTRLKHIYRNSNADDLIISEWTDLVRTYNSKIKLYGERNGIKLGTTVNAILLTEKKYYILNVGDSRTYEIRDHVRLITKDHTLVQRELDEGKLTEAQARTDPRRSVLIQCVGASPDVVPDFFMGDTLADCVYMLCSDGFRHEITEDEMFCYLNPSVMTNQVSMDNNMTALIDMDKQRMERDNITVLTIRTF